MRGHVEGPHGCCLVTASRQQSLWLNSLPQRDRDRLYSYACMKPVTFILQFKSRGFIKAGSGLEENHSRNMGW